MVLVTNSNTLANESSAILLTYYIPSPPIFFWEHLPLSLNPCVVTRVSFYTWELSFPGHFFWLKAEGIIAARPVGNSPEFLLELSGAVEEFQGSSPTFNCRRLGEKAATWRKFKLRDRQQRILCNSFDDLHPASTVPCRPSILFGLGQFFWASSS